jgi:hypothetical protein
MLLRQVGNVVDVALEVGVDLLQQLQANSADGGGRDGGLENC